MYTQLTETNALSNDNVTLFTCKRQLTPPNTQLMETSALSNDNVTLFTP